MCTDYRPDLAVHGPAEALRHLGRVEEPGVDDPAGHAADVRQGPGDGVVLIAGYDHRVPRSHKAADGDVQAVGGAGGQDGVVRLGYVKELRRLHPAAQHQVCRQAGGRVVSPSGGGHGAHRAGHRRRNGVRLLQRGGCAVKVDHRASS